jgi:hypothetical protein
MNHFFTILALAPAVVTSRVKAEKMIDAAGPYAAVNCRLQFRGGQVGVRENPRP